MSQSWEKSESLHHKSAPISQQKLGIYWYPTSERRAAAPQSWRKAHNNCSLIMQEYMILKKLRRRDGTNTCQGCCVKLLNQILLALSSTTSMRTLRELKGMSQINCQSTWAPRTFFKTLSTDFTAFMQEITRSSQMILVESFAASRIARTWAIRLQSPRAVSQMCPSIIFT